MKRAEYAYAVVVLCVLSTLASFLVVCFNRQRFSFRSWPVVLIQVSAGIILLGMPHEAITGDCGWQRISWYFGPLMLISPMVVYLHRIYNFALLEEDKVYLVKGALPRTSVRCKIVAPPAPKPNANSSGGVTLAIPTTLECPIRKRFMKRLQQQSEKITMAYLLLTAIVPVITLVAVYASGQAKAEMSCGFGKTRFGHVPLTADYINCAIIICSTVYMYSRYPITRLVLRDVVAQFGMLAFGTLLAYLVSRVTFEGWYLLNATTLAWQWAFVIYPWIIFHYKRTLQPLNRSASVHSSSLTYNPRRITNVVFLALLKDDEAYEHVSKELERRFCTENSLFVRAVFSYRVAPTVGDMLKITSEFIAEGSILEINLSMQERAELLRSVESYKAKNEAPAEVFAPALDTVINLIRNNLPSDFQLEAASGLELTQTEQPRQGSFSRSLKATAAV